MAITIPIPAIVEPMLSWKAVSISESGIPEIIPKENPAANRAKNGCNFNFTVANININNDKNKATTVKVDVFILSSNYK